MTLLPSACLIALAVLLAAIVLCLRLAFDLYRYTPRVTRRPPGAMQIGMDDDPANDDGFYK